MSNLELNKIAASIFLTGIIALLAANIADIIYQPTKTKIRGYEIPVISDIDNKENLIQAVEEKIDLPELLKKANIENGKKITKKCVMCHSFDQNGANKIGPNLWNIVDNKKAHISDYSYSKSLQSLTGTWDINSLYDFLYNPKKYVPGTKMSFVGIKKPQDIADLIAYLATLKN